MPILFLGDLVIQRIPCWSLQASAKCPISNIKDRSILFKMFKLSQFISVQSLSHIWLFATPSTAACQASLSITNSWSSLKLISTERWCHPTISSSVVPFSFCLQSLPASGSFPISQFFASGDQSIGVSASAAILPMNILDWFPLGLTGLNSTVQGTVKSLLNTTVQKHQFFGAQLSLSSNSHIHTWLLEKP